MWEQMLFGPFFPLCFGMLIGPYQFLFDEDEVGGDREMATQLFLAASWKGSQKRHLCSAFSEIV